MTAAEKYYEIMTRTPVTRLILSMSLPTTVSMLITNIYNMADTYFVGTLGESAQGAIGVLFALQCVIQAVAFMLGHGSGSFVAKELADKDPARASSYVSGAFWLGGAVGLFFLIVGLCLTTPLMYLLGSSDTILPYACDYCRWVVIAAPLLIMSIVLNNNLRYEGKTFYAMIGLTSGGLLNIFLDWLFVPVFGWGVSGAGAATALSQVVSFTILLVMHCRKAQASVAPRYISRDPRDYLAILRVGFPSLIRQGLNAISHGVLNHAAKAFGDAAVAAMSIVSRYTSFVISVGLGVGQGFQPVSAFNYEAGEYDRVRRGLLITSGVAFAAVGTLAALGFVFAEPIVRAFQSAPAVVEIGTFAVRAASVGALGMPIFFPVNMLYQSIRRAGVASFLALLRSGVLFIPLLLILTSLFGLLGVQIAQPAADLLTAAISVPFIVHFYRNTPPAAAKPSGT
ncbi:MAG: MATE family efflux transporter [Eubacteriales bacterium]|nr:MATE family efflux transporter [Eubacteriales bacterium]